MKKGKGKLHILQFVFAVILAIVISISPITTQNAKAAIVVTYSTTMYTNDKMQIDLDYTQKNVKLKSSNTKIATISKTGWIKTKNKTGKVVITVKYPKGTDRYNITVKKDKYAITINKSSLTLNGHNDSFQLKASSPSKKKILFKSYSEDVAKISSDGVITPVQNGRCRIIAYIQYKNIYRQKDCMVTVKGCPKPAAEKPKYTYELYTLDGLNNDGWFNLVERPIFIKTKNPDINSIKIYSDNFDIYASTVEVTGYEDLDYSGLSSDERLLKVPGGYVANIFFGSNANKSAPSFTGYVVIRENEKVAINMQCTVHNVNYESKQAVKRIVNTVSKDGMTPFDKMQAFVDYVESKHPRYYWNDGEYLYKFAADTDDSLWFYNWRFDSLVTPTVLYQAAQEIGGFDEIKNLYYDGSWSEHWYAQVRIGNDTRKYTFCPMASSGYIEDTSSRKVNFGDLSKFTRIY